MDEEYRLSTREERNSWQKNQETTDAMVEQSKNAGQPRKDEGQEKKNLDKPAPGEKKVDTAAD